MHFISPDDEAVAAVLAEREELLRQLMERQALRRVDTGELTEEQEERIGLTLMLMLLEDRMDVLREKFGLEPGDLNIDLGPLGPLLPTER
ncbi:gas vesicle protein K [Streptomyces sp. A3M-1-3]|uniref:gas vesicle protein K n=1 Tax=Streptomyces sp. A3M-1-3 TaxID=2962044 RepID=UPI0020B6E2E5|nr:gas vesicle protein K [Streptomyces sp. A3M-1-3]MCP3819110.1 gas vesicle protein K [Streptomyces sp. A3M-1-3]